MGRDVQIILAEALRLRDDERAELAADLIASLDEPARIAQEEIDRLWAVEIERRSRQMLRGESVGVPWEVVRARTERKLAGTESTMASKSAPCDLWFDATTVGPDLIVETWIEHSPRARDEGFDPQPGDWVTVGDDEGRPIRGCVIQREGNRVLAQLDLADVDHDSGSVGQR